MRAAKRGVPPRQQGYVLVTVMVAAFLVATIAFMVTHQSSMKTNMAAGDLERDEARYVAEAGFQHALWQAQQAGCSNYASLTNEPFGDHSYSVAVSPTDGSPITLLSTGTLGSGASQSLSRSSVSVYDPGALVTFVVTLSAASKDTFIEGKSGHTDHNKADDNELWTSEENRTLLQFDLSALPSSAIVQTATLELYLNIFNSSVTVEAYRLLRDWTEAGVTWNTYDGANSWSTPGGEYDPGVAGSFVANWGPNSMDVTALAQAWVDGSRPNHGLILLSPPAGGGGSGTENKYHSADKDNEPHPKLTLTYSCECGTVCTGFAVGTTIILSTGGSANLGGLTFTDKDLAEYDPATDTATLYFDGVSLDLKEDIDAAHVLANGHILLSAIDSITLGGVTAENEDLIDYDPVTDDGTLIFDGSAIFTSGSTDISAVHVLDNGHLLLTNEYPATIGGLNFERTDIIDYDPATNTASMFLDGSTVGMSAWINAVHLLDNGHIVLSAASAATLGGLDFDTDDVVEYDPVTDTATLIFDGDLFAGSEDIRSVHVGPGSGSLTPGSDSKKVLFVVGSVGGAGPTTEEIAHQSLIESWGHTVELIDDDASQAEFDVAAANNDVAYVTNDITASRLGTKLVDATIGVVTSEDNLSDEFGMASTIGWESGTVVEIHNNTHYITSPFPLGTLTIFSGSVPLAYVTGTLSPDLAQLASSTSGYGVVTLEAGASKFSFTDGPSAGRRVQLPWGGSPSLEPGDLTADGLTILQRALEWGAGAGYMGPLAHWKLDDGTGTVAIDSEGGHDGILTNGPVWVAGKLGTAISFDGSNDYIDLTSDQELDDVFVGGATAMAWIEPVGWGNNGYGRIFDKSTSPSATGDGWAIRLNEDNGGLNFGQGFTGGRGWWRFAESSINFNTWHHIALTYDASSAANDPIVYLDGSPVAVTRVDTPSGSVRSDASINLHLGNHASSAATFFDGKIDDARIYDRILDAAEIAELASAGGAGPIAHWKLDDASGETAVDSAGGHDGTLKNAPSWAAGKIDGGLSFDGDDDYIVSSSLNPMSYDDFTVSAWYKSADSGVSDDEYIYEHNDNFSYEVTFGPTDDGTNDRLRFGFANGGSGTWDPHYGTSDIVDQQWHHVVGVRETGRIKLYVDGVLETDGVDAHAGSTVVIDGDGPFIGDLPGNDEEVHGTLDDVRLYDRALSATEIADLFSAAGGGGGGGGGGSCDGTFRDEFNAVSYAGSDGTEAWASDWLEINENGNVSSGDERVDDEDSDYHLQVRDNDGGGEGVQREADLSAYTSANFSFEYRRDGFDNGNDYVMVHVSDNGGSSWTELDRFVGPGTDSSYVPKSYDISAYIAANTRIRYLTSPNHGSGDELYIDNVEISASGCANP